MAEKTYCHDWDDLDEMLCEIARDRAARDAYVDAVHREVRNTKTGLRRLKARTYVRLPRTTLRFQKVA
jgi:hypothetical protein